METGPTVAAGEVRPGESWLYAAERVAGDGALPVPVDLSVSPMRFALLPDVTVALRLAGEGDLPDLIRWRQADHVLRWWKVDGEPTPERVRGQYAPEIAGETATTLWIVEVNGRSVGFVQDYRLDAYPEYALLTPDPRAVGIDYAIGEASWVGRGLGAVVLWSWLRTAVRRFPEVSTVFAAPDHRNRASLRILEKVGFVAGTWFDDPDGSTVVGCSLDLPTVIGRAAAE